MRRLLVALTVLANLAPVAAHADSWGSLATISAEPSAGYVCIGDTNGHDILCATPGPSVDASGNVNIGTGTSHLNFGGTLGTSGYGIRDNSGVLQFKNSGGAWTNLTALSQWTTSGSDIYYSTGNVGIGTSTPEAALEVRRTSGTRNAVFSNTSSQKLWLGSVADTIGTYIGGNAYYYSSYQFMPNYSSASGINFRQNGSTEFWNDTGLTSGVTYLPTARMVISNTGTVYFTGSVGIGTASPATQLEIKSADSSALSIYNTLPGTAAVPVEAKLQFKGYAGSIRAEIAGQDASSNLAGGALVLRTRDAAGNLQDRLLLDRNGNVAIGTTTAVGKLTVQGSSTYTATSAHLIHVSGEQSTANSQWFTGINAAPVSTLTSGTATYNVGGRFWPDHQGAGTVTHLEGINATAFLSGTGDATNIYGVITSPYRSGTGSVTNMYGFHSSCHNGNASGSVTNCYGLYLGTPTGAGTITNKWGVYQVDANSKSYFAGNVGVGTNVAAEKVTVSGNIKATGSIQVSDAGTTCASAADYGKIRYNTATDKFQICKP